MSGVALRAAWQHIRTKNMSIPSRLVLLAIADRHNQETGRCDPSISRLMKDTRLSERAVRSALRELENLHAIITVERKQRTGRGKKNLTNRYKVLPCKGGAQYAGGMGHNMPPNLKYTPSQFDDLVFEIGGDDV